MTRIFLLCLGISSIVFMGCHDVAGPRSPGASSLPLSPHEFLHGRARLRDRHARDAGAPAAARARAGGQAGVSQRIVRRERALQVLGLPPAADRKAVRHAFRQLARRLHPDRHPGADSRQLAALMRGFAEVTAAYHELVA